MKKAMIFLATILLTLPLAAQHQNKAVLSTDSGEQQLNTSEIQCIRFDGGRVTVVQPWGTTVFDRTLRELTFLRPLPGTVRLTVDATIGNDTESVSRRALSLGGDGKVRSTWETGDRVYVYANNTSTESLGTLTPETTGAATARLVGDVAVGGLSDGQTLYLSTMPRPHTFDAQTGRLEDIFFATAQSQLTIVEGNASLANTTFANAQAITRFTMNDGYGNDVSVSQLVITGGAGTITVTPTAATSELYVAMPATNSQTTYSFTATAADGVRSGVKTANVQQGNYYRTSVTVKLTASVSAAPTAVNWLTYNGGAQTLVNAGTPVGGTMQYAVTTTNSQPNSGFSTTLPTSTNAGTYYVWYYVEGDSDHTDTGVSSTAVTVTIGRISPSLSLSPTSLSLTSSSPTGTITVSRDGDGAITASSSDMSVATTSVSGNTVTVTAIANGSATITVKMGQGTNYTAYTESDKTVSVSASGFERQVCGVSAVTSSNTDYVGYIICSNGHVHTTANPGCGGSAVAMIVYVGDPGTADASSSTYKGLAVALTDAGRNVKWYTAKNGTCVYQNSTFSNHYNYGDMNGIANTNKLAGATCTSGHNHAAAKAAKNYSVAVPTGCSQWFLPTSGQWFKFFRNSKLNLSWTDWGIAGGTGSDNFNNVNKMFTDAGASSAVFINDGDYWASSEYSAGSAVDVYITSSNGVDVNYYTKSATGRVRAFLAF